MKNSNIQCQLVTKAIISGSNTKMIVNYGRSFGPIDFLIFSDFH